MNYTIDEVVENLKELKHKSRNINFFNFKEKKEISSEIKKYESFIFDILLENSSQEYWSMMLIHDSLQDRVNDISTSTSSRNVSEGQSNDFQFDFSSRRKHIENELRVAKANIQRFLNDLKLKQQQIIDKIRVKIY
jgi:hypothetical protein